MGVGGDQFSGTYHGGDERQIRWLRGLRLGDGCEQGGPDSGGLGSSRVTRLPANPLSFRVPQRSLSCVEPAGTVDAGPRMSVAGAEVQTAHRRAIAKVREHGPKEQLVIEVSAAAAEVPAHQVLVHGLQIDG